MCLIALAFQVFDDCPVAVAANREEYFDRPADPPALRRAGTMPVVCGQDLRAGGTWLGVNGRGVLVAVTNRWFVESPPEPRSRGSLAMELLACATARQAAELAHRELATGRYAGVNYVCLDAASGHVVSFTGLMEVRGNVEQIDLRPGLHLLTNGPLNDASDFRQRYFRSLLADRSCDDTTEFSAVTQAILRTGPDESQQHTIIVRDDHRGTVSSSIVLLPRNLQQSRWWYAPEAPDRVDYQDRSAILVALLTGKA
ncbi:MAG: NRDE family protein [Pirellulales bacterium]|nr:NRDE family protein [Pirellulales bacterium]